MKYPASSDVTSNHHRLCRPLPLPPSFGLLESSIETLGTIFPYLPPPLQDSLAETFSKFNRQKIEKSGKRKAVHINVQAVLLGITETITAALKIRDKSINDGVQPALSPKAANLMWECCKVIFFINCVIIMFFFALGGEFNFILER